MGGLNVYVYSKPETTDFKHTLAHTSAEDDLLFENAELRNFLMQFQLLDILHFLSPFFLLFAKFLSLFFYRFIF